MSSTQAVKISEDDKKTFGISLLANVLQYSFAENAEILQKILTEKINAAIADSYIQEEVGLWELVWGPVVYQAPLDVSVTNAMYIAREKGNSHRNRYVVAIAGTHRYSIYTWVAQNLNIFSMTPWEDKDKIFCENFCPKITNGIALGLETLLNMKSNDLTVMDFLGQTVVMHDETDIVVTGHSLGGTLSPAFALAVHDQAPQWAGGNSFKIYVLSTAGYTPGNHDFSDYYGQRLEATTKRIWNEMDMVPQAWIPSKVLGAPFMYGRPASGDVLVDLGIVLAGFFSASVLVGLMIAHYGDNYADFQHILPDAPSMGPPGFKAIESPQEILDKLERELSGDAEALEKINYLKDQLAQESTRSIHIPEQTIRDLFPLLKSILNEVLKIADPILDHYLTNIEHEHIQAYIDYFDLTEMYEHFKETIGEPDRPFTAEILVKFVRDLEDLFDKWGEEGEVDLDDLLIFEKCPEYLDPISVGNFLIEIKLKGNQSDVPEPGHEHERKITQIHNKLSVPVVIHRGDDSPDIVEIPAGGILEWGKMIPWVSGRQEMRRKAMTITLGHTLFARIYSHYRKHKIYLNDGRDFICSVPLSDLSIDQAVLVIDGKGFGDLPTEINPNLYYRIRESTKGEYVKYDGSWLRRWEREEIDEQLFFFKPLGDGWYQISCKAYPDLVWTLEHGSGIDHGIYWVKLAKPEEEPSEYNRFKLTAKHDGSGYQIDEATKGEVIEIGDPSFPFEKGYLVRWAPDNSAKQRYRLEEAGPQIIYDKEDHLAVE